MKKLTEREAPIMQIIWHRKEAFIRDILEDLPEPKPHYNTVATLVKILVKKGFLKSEKLGNMDRYHPVISLEAYRQADIDALKETYFENSPVKMLAHFARQEALSEQEIEALICLIKSKKTN